MIDVKWTLNNIIHPVFQETQDQVLPRLHRQDRGADKHTALTLSLLGRASLTQSGAKYQIGELNTGICPEGQILQ